MQIKKVDFDFDKNMNCSLLDTMRRTNISPLNEALYYVVLHNQKFDVIHNKVL